MSDWLDEQDFYELCQQYRHAPLFPIDIVLDAYEALKAHIRRQITAAAIEESDEPESRQDPDPGPSPSLTPNP